MVKRHYDNSELMNYKEREPNLENFEGKELLLHFDSFCLGDTICFSSLMDAFMDYHKPKYVWVTTFFPHLLKSNRSDYEFINANESGFLEIDKLVDVGYDKNNMAHTLGGMFYAAKDTMRLPQETKPGKCPVIPKLRTVDPNKITMGPETIKEISQWKYKENGGWQEVVNSLHSGGYNVYNVSYENTMNLENVIGFHGHDDLNVAIDHIISSRLFVGLSSGLSWLAWAYGVPVVMISNFTKSQNEFDCFRVTNPYVCNGCFNMFPNIKTKCPIFLGTERENECHTKIKPKMVIDKINEAIIFTNKN
jgi:autotransporter strand-loop-strand O-heptosyltransferase